MALVFDPVFPIDNLEPDINLGLYLDYEGLNYWSGSFGFYAVCAATGMYGIGLVLAIVFDIQPLKRMKHRMFTDFRNIEVYRQNAQKNANPISESFHPEDEGQYQLDLDRTRPDETQPDLLNSTSEPKPDSKKRKSIPKKRAALLGVSKPDLDNLAVLRE